MPLSIKRNYKPSLGLVSVTGEFYQKFEEELILILHKCFKKIKEEGPFFNLFCEARITPTQNSEK